MHGTLPIADVFMSADRLCLTAKQRAALIETLELLESGRLTYMEAESLPADMTNGFSGHFNMAAWATADECGTVACIGGTACLLAKDETLFGGDKEYTYQNVPLELDELFTCRDAENGVRFPMDEITPAQAARALRSCLTIGSAHWNEAVL